MADEVVNESQNSFATGFTLGVLTGAVGYFLFATERGTKLRYQLLQEWEEAKGRLVDEGIIQDRQIPLRRFLNDVLNKFVNFTDDVQNPTQHTYLAESPKKLRVSSGNRTRKSSSQKFKGV